MAVVIFGHGAAELCLDARVWARRRGGLKIARPLCFHRRTPGVLWAGLAERRI
jgi:hypothetical protein